MKQRLGFISNSSSSSYICYPEHHEETIKPKKLTTNLTNLPKKKIGKEGCKEFGWGPEELHDSESKINWCFIQAGYAQNEELLEKIALVVEDYEQCIIEDLSELFETKKPNRPYEICSFKFRGTQYYQVNSESYIDHQSAYPDNSEMLKSMDEIRTFIYGEAFIVLQNDNDYDDYYYDDDGSYHDGE